MRKAIVIAAVLIALLAGGLLAVPRLLEWDDYRAELTAKAEAITGQTVTIRGHIDLDLLPQPTLSLARTTLASAPDAGDRMRLEVDRLDLELKPLPLLGGRLDVEEVRLDSGRCTVLIGGRELQVSRRHTRELRDLLVRNARPSSGPSEAGR